MSVVNGSEQEPGTVDLVVDAVLAVPGVSGLHAGAFGEVGTYLPGRRVAGVRLGDDATEVHIAVVMGSPIAEVAERVVAAVSPLVHAPVRVFVEDVTTPAERTTGDQV